MAKYISFFIPTFFCFVFLYGKIKHVPIYAAFMEGARHGLKAAWQVLPPLLLMFALIALYRESGLQQAAEQFLTPMLGVLGVPQELISMILIRPLSGSGALALASDVMAVCGADSRSGILACVIAATGETILYTLTLYLTAGRIAKAGKLIALAALLYLFGVMAAFFFTGLFC